MADFYIPKTVTATLPDGRKVRLIRGVGPVPDALANHPSANDLGIKPVEEMTAAERRAVGLGPAPAAAVQPDA